MVMESSTKVYYADKKQLLIFLCLSLVPMMVLFYLHPGIMRVLHLPSSYDIIYGMAIGMIYVFVSYGRLRPFSNPKIRICDHFLIYSYDQRVIEWNQITHMRVTAEGWLMIDASSAGKSCGGSINMRSLSNREEFLEDIGKLCETKGIPLDRPDRPENSHRWGFFNT
jgi:hypothetical protein